LNQNRPEGLIHEAYNNKGSRLFNLLTSSFVTTSFPHLTASLLEAHLPLFYYILMADVSVYPSQIYLVMDAFLYAISLFRDYKVNPIL